MHQVLANRVPNPAHVYGTGILEKKYRRASHEPYINRCLISTTVLLCVGKLWWNCLVTTSCTTAWLNYHFSNPRYHQLVPTSSANCLTVTILNLRSSYEIYFISISNYTKWKQGFLKKWFRMAAKAVKFKKVVLGRPPSSRLWRWRLRLRRPQLPKMQPPIKITPLALKLPWLCPYNYYPQKILLTSSSTT